MSSSPSLASLSRFHALEKGERNDTPNATFPVSPTSIATDPLVVPSLPARHALDGRGTSRQPLAARVGIGIGIEN